MPPKISKNRQKFAHSLTVDEVVDYDSLCEYAHHLLGTPYPKSKEHAIVRKVLKGFFEDYPDANYKTLTDVVTWAKARSRHYEMHELFACYRYAYKDGYMRILTNGGSTNDGETLSAMLQNVSNDETRERMVAAPSAMSRDNIYNEYILSTEGGVSSGTAKEPIPHPLLDSLGLFVGQVLQYRIVPSDAGTYGTVVGEQEEFIRVYNSGVVLHLSAFMISVRKAGTWTTL